MVPGSPAGTAASLGMAPGSPGAPSPACIHPAGCATRLHGHTEPRGPQAPFLSPNGFFCPAPSLRGHLLIPMSHWLQLPGPARACPFPGPPAALGTSPPSAWLQLIPGQIPEAECAGAAGSFTQPPRWWHPGPLQGRSQGLPTSFCPDDCPFISPSMSEPSCHAPSSHPSAGHLPWVPNVPLGSPLMSPLVLQC